MASQLSKKAALPLAKILATRRNNVSNTGPSSARRRHEYGPTLVRVMPIRRQAPCVTATCVKQSILERGGEIGSSMFSLQFGVLFSQTNNTICCVNHGCLLNCSTQLLDRTSGNFLTAFWVGQIKLFRLREVSCDGRLGGLHCVRGRGFYLNTFSMVGNWKWFVNPSYEY